MDSIKKNSYKIAKIANIDSICNSLEDMSNKVDAVILARDDIENHLEMAKIFLKKKIPIFIDKLIVPDVKSLKKFQKISKINFICHVHQQDILIILRKF